MTCKIICESKYGKFWFHVNFNNTGQVSIFSRSMLLCWSINLCMNELRGSTQHLSFVWRRVRVSLTHTHTRLILPFESSSRSLLSFHIISPVPSTHLVFKEWLFFSSPLKPSTYHNVQFEAVRPVILIWGLLSNSSVWVTRLRESERAVIRHDRGSGWATTPALILQCEKWPTSRSETWNSSLKNSPKPSNLADLCQLLRIFYFFFFLSVAFLFIFLFLDLKRNIHINIIYIYIILYLLVSQKMKLQ